METLLVKTKNKNETKLVSDLLKKMRIQTVILSDEEREDIGLIKLMKQANRNEKVVRQEIMAKLGK